MPVGTTITWVNLDSSLHTTTSGLPGSATDLFDSGSLSQNGKFSFTFTEAGKFDYFCEFHPSLMTATVTVTAP